MNQLLEKRLEEIVLANISNQHFDSAELSREACISRYQLHRLMKEMHYRNVRCFIKDHRLNRAKDMLLRNEGTSAEIAYKVGFCNPAYFNKCFHEYFGSTPGSVKRGSLGCHDNPEDDFSRDFNAESDFGLKIGETFSVERRFNFITIILILAFVIMIMTLLMFLFYFTLI